MCARTNARTGARVRRTRRCTHARGARITVRVAHNIYMSCALRAEHAMYIYMVVVQGEGHITCPTPALMLLMLLMQYC